MNNILEYLSVTPGQVALISVLGVLIGIDKMGLRGGPIVIIPFLAAIFGARFTAGLIIPLFLFADILAVIAYRTSCNWRLVIKVLIWSLIGTGFAALVGGYVPEEIFRILLGVILLILLGTMTLFEFRIEELVVPDTPVVTVSIGITAGFASMIGNAAGPILSLFLIAKRLPKQFFLGTSTMIFLVLNCFKLVLHVFYWQTVNTRSLRLDMIAIPFILLGALLGKPLVRLIPEKSFRYFIMAISLIGVVQLFIV